MTCIELMDLPGTQVTFTPDYMTAILRLSNGSEHRFTSNVLEDLLVGGFIQHTVGGLAITVKGRAQAVREREQSV